MSTINLGNVKDLEVDLAKRDKILGDMEAQLYGKRFLLLQKREALKNSMKQNRFLEEVKKDYDNYHEFLVTQKKEQIDALEYINSYISDIQNEGNINDEKINESRVQQEWILSELKNIKNELNEIIGVSK
jgi:hypothetical protein